MKSKLLAIILIITLNLSIAQNFDNYFINKTLRIDYLLIASCDTFFVIVKQLYQEPVWNRFTKQFPFDYGYTELKVFDKQTGNLIYRYEYNSIANEWLKICHKLNEPSHIFTESIIMPYPKVPVNIQIVFYDKYNRSHKALDYDFDPSTALVNKELPPKYPIDTVIYSGPSAEKVDIVVLPDGFTKDEMASFQLRAREFIDKLFATKPFSDNVKAFNVYLILAPSMESGIDIPQDNIWRNSLFDSHFYTFGVPRYLTTENMWQVRRIAALVPYDYIMLLVNTKKYGGGGFYNYLSVTSAFGYRTDEVFVHEFGHQFAGLADEYIDTAMQDFYSTEVEPKPANITTLKQFDKKWANLVADTIPIPTPKVKEYEDVVGVFEGAGYREKGIYRPKIHCLMRSLGNEFCPVCQNTIIQFIDFYTNQK